MPHRLATLTLLALALAVSAQTSYPMITHTHPVAVQRGRTTAIEVSGQQNFAGVYQALFQGEGLSATISPTGKAVAGKAPLVRSSKLQITVANDARPGVREFRLASTIGLSSIGQLVVSEHPVIEEKGDNNTREKAQSVSLPCTVAGRIELAEDVDHFRFTARAGQTITFEVQCARIQDKIHDLQKHADPILTLYDSTGRELAANDDTYFADPLLSYTFQQAGDYIVQVRDSKYDGDPRWVYALLITDQPYASHVYPLGVQAGQRVRVSPVGSAGRIQPTVELTAPTTPGVHEVILDTGAGLTNPVPILVSSLRQVQEQEPNDQHAMANRIELPCGINGRIDAPGDADHYVFAAKKGVALRFEVKARRFGTLLQSGLDSVLEVFNSKGTLLLSNDDTVGKDAALLFTPPADGDYMLRIRDLNSKGGPAWVYHIEAEPARPDFQLTCDGDKAMIGRGGRVAWYVQLTRTGGFTGPVTIEAEGLPAGVTASALTIQPGQTQGVLVLSAAPDAALAVAPVRLRGTAQVEIAGQKTTLTRTVEPAQEIYFPGGGRGVFPVQLHAVAVTEPGDILEVQVSPSEIVLKPGGEVRLDVTIRRRPDFTGGVSLDVRLQHLGRVFGNPLPAGVTVVEGKSKTLLGTGNQGHIVLRAAPGAVPVEGVPISVLANVSVNFVVKLSYSSAALPLSVRP